MSAPPAEGSSSRPPPLAGIAAPDTELSSAELLSAVTHASPVPIVVSCRDTGEILYCNERLAHLAGKPVSELVGRSALDFYEDATERDSILAELSGLGRVSDREIRLRNPNGDPVWAILNLRPLELGGQKLLLGALYDVSRRKRAEQELKKNEARFRAYVENAGELVFEMEPNGTITYLSPALGKLLGYAESQMLGKTLDSWVHADDLPELWACTERAREAARVQGPVEFRIRHRDGSTRWFASTLAPRQDSAGTLVGLTGSAHEISREKGAVDELERVKQQLRETRIQLARTEKMASLGMLVAGIAHEIRTPLGAVFSTRSTLDQALSRLCAHLRQEHPEVIADTKVVRLLEILENSTRVIADGSSRAKDIVQRLRSYSCADPPQLSRVDVNAIVEDTLALVHHELKHHVRVETQLGTDVTLVGYPGRLNQVLVNLLINASHAIQPKGKGKIVIATSSTRQKVCISIRDDGVGICKEHLSKIFDSGFTTKQTEGGSGLGLAISRDIVRAHRGTLRVESTPGSGTNFTVELPRNLDQLLCGWDSCGSGPRH